MRRRRRRRRGNDSLVRLSANGLRWRAAKIKEVNPQDLNHQRRSAAVEQGTLAPPAEPAPPSTVSLGAHWLHNNHKSSRLTGMKINLSSHIRPFETKMNHVDSPALS